MPDYYCIACGETTRHCRVSAAAAATQVSRTTIYNWLSRGLLHVVVHASGRKYICEESLMTPVFMVGDGGAPRSVALVAGTASASPASQGGQGLGLRWRAS